MTEQSSIGNTDTSDDNAYSKDFMAYCETEFECLANGDHAFDATHHRAAMQVVVEKLNQITLNQRPAR